MTATSSPRLLLVSSSRTHGSGYLEHCEAWVRELFHGRRRVLFVPFALADRQAYAELARDRFEQLGLGLDSLHESADPRAAVNAAEAFFVGGGNTFRLLRELRRLGVLESLAARVRGGAPYLGTSAGSNLAAPTIRTTNDMPIVDPGGFEALGLVPFQLNCHYLDPDPGSNHMGETRETRLREYLEENTVPVVGLREGSAVRVDAEGTRLVGGPAARLFRTDQPAREVEPGSELLGPLGLQP